MLKASSAYWGTFTHCVAHRTRGLENRRLHVMYDRLPLLAAFLAIQSSPSALLQSAYAAPKPWIWPQPVPSASNQTGLAFESTCAPNCHLHGTCHEELGRCDCVPHWKGDACNVTDRPGCTLFWDGMDHKQGHLMTTPCSSTAPKTCRCAEECAADPNTNFFLLQECSYRGGPEAMLAQLNKCPSSCSFNGWCSHADQLRDSSRHSHRRKRQPSDEFKCQCFVGWEGERCEKESAPYCVGGCSGRGKCVLGTCHCRSPFYGADCSLYRTAAGSDRVRYRDSPPAPKDVPRVYVYDLPPQFNTHLYYHMSVNHLNTTITPSLGVPGSDFLVGAAEMFVYERLLSSAARTTDPTEADFFYVPTWQRASEGLGPTLDEAWIKYDNGMPNKRRLMQPVGSLNYFERVVEYVRTTWPYWNRYDGKDHIFTVTPKMGVCDHFIGGAMRQRPNCLTNAILLTHFGSSKAKFGDRWKGPCYVPQQDIVIPPPPGVSLDDSPLFGAAPKWSDILGLSPWFSSVWHSEIEYERPITFFFAGFIPRGKYWPDSYGMPELPKDAPTKALTKANLKRHARMPYHRLARVRNHVWEAAQNPRVALLNQTWVVTRDTRNYTANMAASVFCLAPGGVGPGWGVRIVQAITFGCIPVIVQDEMAQPFEEFLPYHEFAIRVREQDVAGLPDQLAAFSVKKIRSMQEALRCVAPKMLWSSVYGQYGNESGTDDAFRALLDALWERKMAYKLRAESKPMEQLQDMHDPESEHAHQQQQAAPGNLRRILQNSDDGPNFDAEDEGEEAVAAWHEADKAYRPRPKVSDPATHSLDSATQASEVHVVDPPSTAHPEEGDTSASTDEYANDDMQTGGIAGTDPATNIEGYSDVGDALAKSSSSQDGPQPEVDVGLENGSQTRSEEPPVNRSSTETHSPHSQSTEVEKSASLSRSESASGTQQGKEPGQIDVDETQDNDSAQAGASMHHDIEGESAHTEMPEVQADLEASASSEESPPYVAEAKGFDEIAQAPGTLPSTSLLAAAPENSVPMPVENLEAGVITAVDGEDGQIGNQSEQLIYNPNIKARSSLPDAGDVAERSPKLDSAEAGYFSNNQSAVEAGSELEIGNRDAQGLRQPPETIPPGNAMGQNSDANSIVEADAVKESSDVGVKPSELDKMMAQHSNMHGANILGTQQHKRLSNMAQDQKMDDTDNCKGAVSCSELAMNSALDKEDVGLRPEQREHMQQQHDQDTSAGIRQATSVPIFEEIANSNAKVNTKEGDAVSVANREYEDDEAALKVCASAKTRNEISAESIPTIHLCKKYCDKDVDWNCVSQPGDGGYPDEFEKGGTLECNRAPEGQPQWLPWPVGGALHT